MEDILGRWYVNYFRSINFSCDVIATVAIYFIPKFVAPDPVQRGRFSLSQASVFIPANAVVDRSFSAAEQRRSFNSAYNSEVDLKSLASRDRKASRTPSRVRERSPSRIPDPVDARKDDSEYVRLNDVANKGGAGDYLSSDDETGTENNGNHLFNCETGEREEGDSASRSEKPLSRCKHCGQSVDEVETG